jgi:hypothetical protein
VTASTDADDGRTAAYAAEDAAFGGTDFDREVELDQLRSVAERVTTSDWWHDCGAPEVVVELARASAHSSSAREGGTRVVIRLAAGQRTAGTLAHELGHALAGVAHGHDATFRAAVLDVVAMVGGAPAAATLAVAFDDLDVSAGRRAWPAPVLLTGPGFAVVP